MNFIFGFRSLCKEIQVYGPLQTTLVNRFTFPLKKTIKVHHMAIIFIFQIFKHHGQSAHVEFVRCMRYCKRHKDGVLADSYTQLCVGLGLSPLLYMCSHEWLVLVSSRP